MTKNGTHTISQISRVTEIQRIFEFLTVTVTIYVKSRLLTAQFKKFQICSDSKTVSTLGICITLRAKMSPTPSLKSSGLPRYNSLGQISCSLKINNFKNFKFAPIRKRFRDSDLHHFASKNVPHTISQILRVTEVQQIRSNQLMSKNR